MFSFAFRLSWIDVRSCQCFGEEAPTSYMQVDAARSSERINNEGDRMVVNNSK
jgi:hypothetical protein